MPAFPVTLATAAVLAIAFVLLSIAVSGERGKSKVGLGAGIETSVALGAERHASPLLIAIRRHGHFAEYVPLSLILMMLLEANHAGRTELVALAGTLVLSRAMIAAGLGRSAPNVLRAGGNVLQLLMILAAAVYGFIILAHAMSPS